MDGNDGTGYPINGEERCAYFEKEFWFKFGKSMWRKKRSIFQDHVKYLHNDIVNPFRVGITQYAEHVRDMHYLAKYLPPTLMKRDEYNQSYWAICNKEFYKYEIRVATKNGITTPLQD